MKLAIISDIHGNLHALDAVLDAIAQDHVDQIICAGDMVTPLPTSLQVWNTLKRMNIPRVRGNHEEYLLNYFASDTSVMRTAPQFRGILYIAECLSQPVVQEFSTLPLCHTVSGCPGETVVICHASLSNTRTSYLDGLDDAMKQDLDRCSGTLIVSGHTHRVDQRTWNGTQMISVGSVGLPEHGAPHAEYLVLTSKGLGRKTWQVDHNTVPYDHHQALKDYTESGCFAYGAPLSWVVYDELWTGERRMGGLFSYLSHHGYTPYTIDEWNQVTQRYLRILGRWEHVRPVIQRHGNMAPHRTG
jgi:putative phosphoesterase